MKATALVCAYRPPRELKALVQALAAGNWSQLIIVDDGSGPAYETLWPQLAGTSIPGRIRLLNLKKNYGKGFALKQGFQYFLDHPELGDTLVCLDADGQHEASDAWRAAEASEKNPFGMVLGTRTFDRRVPFRNRFGNLLTIFLLALFFGRRVKDTQTGLRAFPRSLVPFLIRIPGERFEYEMRQLIELIRARIPVTEVAIATNYPAKSGSHFRPIQDSYRIYMILVTCFLRPKPLANVTGVLPPS